jgi:transitional endoplasmic reticulum ATPase
MHLILTYHPFPQGESEMRVKPVVSAWLSTAHSGQVRSAFAFAAASAPIIILLDDVHALGNGSSGGDGCGNGNRVIGVLCGILDGLSADLFSGRCGIFVVATTSKPECVHSSLRRPGRFETGHSVFPQAAFASLPPQLFLQTLR